MNFFLSCHLSETTVEKDIQKLNGTWVYGILKFSIPTKGICMNKKTLYLASSSRSRQVLLQEAHIPFTVTGHGADEDAPDRSLPFEKLLQEIARLKMEHALLPEGTEGQEIYVLCADSMGYDAQGTVHGKPKDREDAIAKIKALGEKSFTATAFCLDKKVFRGGRLTKPEAKTGGAWECIERVERVVGARYRFVIPDEWLDQYLEHSWAMTASGAVAVEFYGAQFLEWIDGSYSAVMGLPMFELRQALEHLGFFD